MVGQERMLCVSYQHVILDMEGFRVRNYCFGQYPCQIKSRKRAKKEPLWDQEITYNLGASHCIYDISTWRS